MADRSRSKSPARKSQSPAPGPTDGPGGSRSRSRSRSRSPAATDDVGAASGGASDIQAAEPPVDNSGKESGVASRWNPKVRSPHVISLLPLIHFHLFPLAS